MDTTQATSGEPTVEAEAQSEVPLTEPSQPERDVIDEPQAAAEEIMDVTAACATAENRRSITRPQQRRGLFQNYFFLIIATKIHKSRNIILEVDLCNLNIGYHNFAIST